MKLLFLHGLESGPHGTKYHALTEAFGEVIAPDCSGISDPRQRLIVIQNAIAPIEGNFLVIGSSMGGLMALLLQRAIPQRIAAMLLCAPALQRPEAKGLNAEGLPPTQIIHGRQDSVVPISASRKFGVPLLEANDDHSLRNSLPIILAEVSKLQKRLETPRTCKRSDQQKAKDQ